MLDRRRLFLGVAAVVFSPLKINARLAPQLKNTVESIGKVTRTIDVGGESTIIAIGENHTRRSNYARIIEDLTNKGVPIKGIFVEHAISTFPSVAKTALWLPSYNKELEKDGVTTWLDVYNEIEKAGVKVIGAEDIECMRLSIQIKDLMPAVIENTIFGDNRNINRIINCLKEIEPKDLPSLPEFTSIPDGLKEKYPQVTELSPECLKLVVEIYNLKMPNVGTNNEKLSQLFQTIPLVWINKIKIEDRNRSYVKNIHRYTTKHPGVYLFVVGNMHLSTDEEQKSTIFARSYGDTIADLAKKGINVLKLEPTGSNYTEAFRKLTFPKEPKKK